MPTTAVAFALSPPEPSATSSSPTATPTNPGSAASAMCPAMITMALKKSTRSEPSRRSAIHAPRIVER